MGAGVLVVVHENAASSTRGPSSCGWRSREPHTPNGTLRRQLDELWKAREPLRRQIEALDRARRLYLREIERVWAGR